MKFSRTIALILALCMVMSVLATGMFTASAAEDETTPAEAVTESTEAVEKSTTETDASEQATESSAEVNDGQNDYWWKTTFAAWTSVNDLSDEDEAKYSALIEDHYTDKDDYYFFPRIIIASQSGSEGTIDALLCLTGFSEKKQDWDMLGMTTDEKWYYNGRSAWLTVFTIFTDNNGNKRIIKAEKIDPEKMSKSNSTPEGGNAPWIITDKQTKSAQDYQNNAIKNYESMELSYISEIGELFNGWDNTGKELLLCFGTNTSGEKKTDLYLAEIQKERNDAGDGFSDDTAELTSVSFFDLTKYVPSQAEIDNLINKNSNNTGNSDKAQNNSDSNANTNNVSTTSTGSNASATSPKTGQEDTIVFVMLGVMILASAVIFYVRKRERT